MVGFVLSIYRGFKDLDILFIPILEAKFAILVGTCTFFDILIPHGIIFLDNGTTDNICKLTYVSLFIYFRNDDVEIGRAHV